MRIPDAVKKCVVFIGIKKPSESIDQIKYLGTGFLVSMPATIPNQSFIYLVAAKHVAVEIKGSDFYVRANSKSGKSAIFKGADNVKWSFHPDEVWPADVAVLPMIIPEEIFQNVLDYSAIPTDMFLTDEARMAEGIGEGDDIFTVGLFSHHTGSEKNIPIIRMGNIAMISDEPIRTTKFGNIEAYLIEMRSTGGLSGSPVFVLKPMDIVSSRWKIYLLGLIHGHWDIGAKKIIDTAAQDAGIKAGVNVGIAMVVPAKKILETIKCKELADIRAKGEARTIAENSPIPDLSGEISRL